MSVNGPPTPRPMTATVATSWYRPGNWPDRPRASSAETTTGTPPKPRTQPDRSTYWVDPAPSSRRMDSKEEATCLGFKNRYVTHSGASLGPGHSLEHRGLWMPLTSVSGLRQRCASVSSCSCSRHSVDRMKSMASPSLPPHLASASTLNSLLSADGFVVLMPLL